MESGSMGDPPPLPEIPGPAATAKMAVPELFASSRTAIPCARPDACGAMQMHACGVLARPVTHGRDEIETLP